MRFRPFLLVLALLATVLPARAEDLRLTLLHTTDLHGALLPWDDLADRPASGGLARIATLVRRVRAEGGRVVLVDAGDCIQGSPMETLHQLGDRQRPDPMMLAMNAIGYDAFVVGNHEFDFGPGPLQEARDAARFPWLGGNVLRADGTPAFAPSTVKVLDSLRVGIVGVTTPATARFTDPARLGNLRFGSPVEAARAEVARLRQQRCDLIVLVAHTGLERDPAGGAPRTGDAPDENWAYRLATEVSGVDVLVIGHTHAVIGGTVVGGTLVTQAGARGEGLGRVDLTLSRERAGAPWKVTQRTPTFVAATDSIAPDSAIVALARADHVIAQDQLAHAVGHARTAIGSPAGRTADGPLWRLIHDVQLRATGADVSLASLPDPALTLGPGPVTMADLFRAAPFENTLVVVELTGAQLDETLEQSARGYAPYTFAEGAPLFDTAVPAWQMEGAGGVSYQVDLTRPPGDRVVNLTRDGRPVAADDRLKVAVTSYRASGAGGYDAIRNAPRVGGVNRTVRELLAEAVADTARRDTAADEEAWTVLPDWVGLPERPLVDRLVRLGALPREEATRVFPLQPARRGDLAYWLARSFGWREKKLSGAYPDLPDSLEPWLDGLVRRKVLKGVMTAERFEPFRPVGFQEALDWCEAAGRSAGYTLSSALGDPAFRRSLMTGVDLGAGAGRFVYREGLTRAQALGMVANLRYPAIRVLETTDFHGAILPGARERRSGRAWGSSAVLAAHVARLRRANPEGTVLLDGGDWYQGTMISNLAFGRPVVEQMNALGYAAAAIGNHEFDWSADTLQRRVRELKCAALGANMRERKTGRMPRWVRSDTLFTRRGLRVGVLGLCYPATPTVTLPSNVAHLRFLDDSATAVPIVQRLRRGRADVVIGVGHIPGNTDSTRRPRGDIARLARGVPGVDVWMGGHSHNTLVGDVDGVPAMISGSHGQWIGVCDLVVDPVTHRALEHRAWLEPTYADQVTPDSAMAARVELWNADVSRISAEPLGRSTSALNRSGAENLVGNLVTDAIRSVMQVDVVFQNSGGLRADLPAGVITRGMIYEVMPFENTVVTMKLTGRELRQALEEGLRSGRVAQVSGIRYTYDPDAPPMHRVVDVTLPDGSPVDPDRDYKVAVNNFMAQGGDDYELFRTAREKLDTQVPVREELEAYVRERSKNGGAIDVRPDGRIRRVASAR